MVQSWHKTACILCPSSCGLGVKLEKGGKVAQIRGEKSSFHSCRYTALDLFVLFNRHGW